MFWESHNPGAPRRSTQYKAAVFCHDQEQHRLGQETAARASAEVAGPVTTKILIASRFYRAEHYHQKFRLRRHSGWMAKLQAIYPDPQDFTDSTARRDSTGTWRFLARKKRSRPSWRR